MPNINDYVEDCLRFFAEDAGILDEILFIGAWARYFYREIFDSTSGYHARMLTKDLDILVPRELIRAKRKVDVHTKLAAAGFEPLFTQNGLVTYSRDALELEFLVPARGSARNEPVAINAYNINAQELAHLSMLVPNAICVPYGGYQVRVPEPVDYSLHKLIISQRRAKVASAEQDRRDAEEVLYPLSKQADFEDQFCERIKALSRKQRTAVTAGIETFALPKFREQLLELDRTG